MEKPDVRRSRSGFRTVKGTFAVWRETCWRLHVSARLTAVQLGGEPNFWVMPSVGRVYVQ